MEKFEKETRLPMNTNKICEAMGVRIGRAYRLATTCYMIESSEEETFYDYEGDDVDQVLHRYVHKTLYGKDLLERTLARVLKEKGYIAMSIDVILENNEYRVYAQQDTEYIPVHFATAGSKPLAMLGALDKLLEEK